MIRRRTVIALMSAAAIVGAGPAFAQDTVKIGLPMALTGVLAAVATSHVPVE